MRRLAAILAFGVSLLGLAACTGSPSGASFVPQQSALDQGVPLLDQGVPLLSHSRNIKDQGVPLL